MPVAVGGLGQLGPLLRHYGREGGRHVHSHAQVLFGLDGALCMEVEGRDARVDASSGLIVPAGQVHSYRAEGRARVLVFDCEHAPALARLRRLAPPPGWRERLAEQPAHGLLEALLGQARTLAPRRPIDFEALAARIDAEPAGDWSVAALAAACHLSPQRLRARCAEALGCSPQHFVRQRRLARAEQWLRAGLALEAVALQVGYGSASALSVALRRERGTGARRLRAAATGRALRES
ncbi:helix-turn-helix transcriptional regulator [Aquabacterium sp. OR-4]|uniref:helix-turn-helix transcriptional regulator n=1 Tax=Aquabacterium sp. OR-4 TaxID=2978127 RepID=UPI0021B2DAE0|nr:AraC family transcriptional regulator [Aquabacterium sp. OR-4]MDT7838651.1 AraC family transcriptional regulator [Aquabacterium sp. OR-4]